MGSPGFRLRPRGGRSRRRDSSSSASASAAEAAVIGLWPHSTRRSATSLRTTAESSTTRTFTEAVIESLCGVALCCGCGAPSEGRVRVATSLSRRGGDRLCRVGGCQRSCVFQFGHGAVQRRPPRGTVPRLDVRSGRQLELGQRSPGRTPTAFRPSPMACGRVLVESSDPLPTAQRRAAGGEG